MKLISGDDFDAFPELNRRYATGLEIARALDLEDPIYPVSLCTVQSHFRIDPTLIRIRGLDLRYEEILRLQDLPRERLTSTHVPNVVWQDTMAQFYVRADKAIVTSEGVVHWGFLNVNGGINWTGGDPTELSQKTI